MNRDKAEKLLAGMTPPESGDREVPKRCSFFVGDGKCVLSAGHDGRHALLWESAPVVILSLPLAQRILAALEGMQSHFAGAEYRALASELRAAMEKKT